MAGSLNDFSSSLVGDESLSAAQSGVASSKKIWKAPQVILGELSHAEAGASAGGDGGTTTHS